MNIQTSEIKVGISEFSRAVRFYTTLFNVKIAFQSSRVALLVQGDSYLLIESVSDDAAEAFDSQVVFFDCHNLYGVKEYFDSIGLTHSMADTAWDSFITLEDPAGNVCQFREVVGSATPGMLDIAA